MVSDTLKWSSGILSFLPDDHQTEFADQVRFTRHKLAEVLWSTDFPGEHCILVSGQAALYLNKGEPDETKHWLKQGDSFGDLLNLGERVQIKAASPEVAIARWRTEVWSNSDRLNYLRDFLEEERQRYPPEASEQPQPAPQHPFIFCINAAAACIVMQAWELGIPLQLEQVESRLHGQQPEDVIAAAAKFEFFGQFISEADSTLFERISYPVMIGWRSDWAMVFGYHNRRLLVSDPRNLRRTCESYSWSDVQNYWDGCLLRLEHQPQKQKFNLSWFLPSIWRYRKELAEVLVASLTLHLMGLGTPVLSQIIIDKAIVHGNLPTLNVMATALFCIVLFQTILSILRMLVFSHITKLLELSLTGQLFDHLLKLPLPYFEQRRVGDTVARVSELDSVREFLTGTTLTVIIDAAFSIIYVVWMLIYSPKLTVVAFSILPLLIVLVVCVTPVIRRWLNKAWNYKADAQSYGLEVVSSIRATKARSAEFITRQRFERLFARYVNQNFRVSIVSNLNYHLGEMLLHLSELLILFFGAKLVLEGQQITIGQLIAFQMVSNMALHPLLRLAGLVDEFQQVSLSTERLADIFDAVPETHSASETTLPAIKGSIEFESVGFAYADSKQPDKTTTTSSALAVQDVSFSALPGQSIGIVGSSGSGKSTMVNLLLQLYRQTSGRILLDGIDTRQISPNSLRRQMAVVLQDDAIFKGTILENIAFNSKASEAQIYRAAKLALVDQFAPDLNAEVGERGIGLSGGERQRIALSRLFLSKAPILILDEATSALDAHTEREVLNNLKQASQNQTVFMVTHKLASVKDADLILVMKNGRLIEQGQHPELMAQGGDYWSLWKRQHEF